MVTDAGYPAELARYSRQMLYEHVGVEGQKRLSHASVVLVGCGALGSVLANTLVRAGIGALRVIDRDFIELDNLQRQVLFDEHDIAQNLPKAEAAVRKLRKINSGVEIDGLVADVNPGNIEDLCTDADLILDGTDNLETRFLLNDVAVKHELPWVFGACLGAEGLVLPIVPHRTACLRCIWDEPPLPGTVPTCDTVGVLATVVQVVASLQATEALKILLGRAAEVSRQLLAVDVWAGRIRALHVQAAFDDGDCVCCQQGRYDFLAGRGAAATTTLCGRDAVQIMPAERHAGQTPARIDFKRLASRLPPRASPKFNEFLLRFTVDAFAVTLFADGRAIIQGTSDPAVARGVYAKYVGA
jgi:adenylyltransferase/sulfurtransferase